MRCCGDEPLRGIAARPALPWPPPTGDLFAGTYFGEGVYLINRLRAMANGSEKNKWANSFRSPCREP